MELTVQTHAPGASLSRLLARAASMTVMIAGGLMLLGCLAAVAVLERSLAGYILTMAGGAAALLLAGAALWLQWDQPVAAGRRRLAGG
nr:hypothetical protein [Pseudomonadota bacterium]